MTRLPRLAAAVVVPLVVYLLVRPHTGNDAAALAVAGGIPATFAVARFAWRRRIDPVGLVIVAGFGIAVLVSALTGGSSLVLKVRDAVPFGAIGVAFLLSAAVGKPLLGPLLQRAGRGGQLPSSWLTVGTVIIGLTLTVDAVARVALALVLKTSTFLAVEHEASWSILALGAAALWFTRRRATGRARS
jgi:hypothetical protein